MNQVGLSPTYRWVLPWVVLLLPGWWWVASWAGSMTDSKFWGAAADFVDGSGNFGDRRFGDCDRHQLHPVGDRQPDYGVWRGSLLALYRSDGGRRHQWGSTQRSLRHHPSGRQSGVGRLGGDCWGAHLLPWPMPIAPSLCWIRFPFWSFLASFIGLFPSRPMFPPEVAMGPVGWGMALRDKRLLVYVLVNIMITTYIAQVQSTMPLYFKNFAQQGAGLSTLVITALFTWNLSLGVICQLPIARFLNRWSRPQALMFSVTLWGVGFVCIGLTGMASAWALVWGCFGTGSVGRSPMWPIRRSRRPWW